MPSSVASRMVGLSELDMAGAVLSRTSGPGTMDIGTVYCERGD